jgi:hypothetical protein
MLASTLADFHAARCFGNPTAGLERRGIAMLTIILVSLFTHTGPASDARERAVRTAASAASAVGTEIRCERVWPDAAAPAPRDSRACAVHFLAQGYGPGWTASDLEVEPLVGGESSWRFTTSQYERMADHVAATCDGPCDPIATRAIELFDQQATAQLGIVDPWTLESFEPLLAKVLAGNPLTDADLSLDDELPWSPMTLWKLRGAVFARHGATFDHPDLERFFYGDRGPDAMPIDLLPVPTPRQRSAVELDDVDRENLQRLWAHQAPQ